MWKHPCSVIWQDVPGPALSCDHYVQRSVMAPTYLSRHLNSQYIVFIHLLVEQKGESCIETQITQHFSQGQPTFLSLQPPPPRPQPLHYPTVYLHVSNPEQRFSKSTGWLGPTSQWQDLHSSLLPNSYPCPSPGLPISPSLWATISLHCVPHTNAIYTHALGCWHTFWAGDREELFTLDSYAWPCCVACAPTGVPCLLVLLLITPSWSGPALVSLGWPATQQCDLTLAFDTS